MNIPLGFEVGTGARVSIPLGHTIVLGQTQLSGKTTTLQAMTERSGVCAIAFITKRGEKSFRAARPIPAYFTETSVMQPYWKFVVSMIEGVQDMKLGFRERGWVMQLCRDYEISKNETDARGKKKRVGCFWKAPKSLREVMNNAKKALAFTKGVNELICLQLVEYLQMAVPEIESAKLSATIDLKPGINVMDISKLTTNVQSLVVRSVVEWVYLHRQRTVVIIPEAWKFLPEGRSTPVSFPVEELIRQGATLQNFVWIDLQDLRGIKKLLLRSIQVWLFGVQREKNEVANTLKSMPTPEHKPSPTEMMQLGIGEFIVAYGHELRKVYVWPAGMEETHAQAIALGQEDAKSWKRIARALDEQEKENIEEYQDRLESDGGGSPGDGLEAGGAGNATPRAAEGRADGAAGILSIGGGRGSTVPPGGDGEEEKMWKEKYETLRAEFDQLHEAHDAMAERIRVSEAAGETVFVVPAHPTNATKQHPASAQGSVGDYAASVADNGNLSAIYEYIVKRARLSPDPGILQLLQSQPELRVQLKRHTLEMADDAMDGRIARLISEKFFDTPRDPITVTKEFKRRGWVGSKTPNSQAIGPLDKISSLGFLTREANGYHAVKGMKVNIVEAK